ARPFAVAADRLDPGDDRRPPLADAPRAFRGARPRAPPDRPVGREDARAASRSAPAIARRRTARRYGAAPDAGPAGGRRTPRPPIGLWARDRARRPAGALVVTAARWARPIRVARRRDPPRRGGGLALRARPRFSSRPRDGGGLGDDRAFAARRGPQRIRVIVLASRARRARSRGRHGPFGPPLSRGDPGAAAFPSHTHRSAARARHRRRPHHADRAAFGGSCRGGRAALARDRALAALSAAKPRKRGAFVRGPLGLLVFQQRVPHRLRDELFRPRALARARSAAVRLGRLARGRGAGGSGVSRRRDRRSGVALSTRRESARLPCGPPSAAPRARAALTKRVDRPCRA